MQMVQRPLRFLDRAPELLRNPSEAAAKERAAGKAIGDQMNSLGAERLQGVRVESVARGDPDSGVEAVSCAGCRGLREIHDALSSGGDAGELRGASQAEQAASAAGAEMPIAVQTDDGSCGLKSTHLAPEVGVGRGDREFRVVVVGNDGENRLQTEFLDE